MERSLEQLKHIDRISRQTRHHRIQLNQFHEQRLQRDLTYLNHDYQQTRSRLESKQNLEQQRERLLNVTVKQIAREKRRPTLSTMNTTTDHFMIESLSKPSEPSPSSSSVRLPPAGKSCQLFSHHCQLYPCQPVYQYTSFIKKENDQTLRKRNPTVDQGPLKAANSSKLEELFTAIEEKKHHQNRRQLAVTVRNQHHLTNRHIFMERSMANLDEQSRQLHQRLTDRKSFGYVKERQHGLRQALQRHLEISAKFCAAT